jgi:hypothetical protein
VCRAERTDNMVRGKLGDHSVGDGQAKKPKHTKRARAPTNDQCGRWTRQKAQAHQARARSNQQVCAWQLAIALLEGLRWEFGLCTWVYEFQVLEGLRWEFGLCAWVFENLLRAGLRWEFGIWERASKQKTKNSQQARGRPRKTILRLHAPSRTPLLLPLLLSHNLPTPPPCSLVRDERTHPHRPRLVVSHSTCPPLSSSPPSEQLCNRSSSNKHTHRWLEVPPRPCTLCLGTEAVGVSVPPPRSPGRPQTSIT